MTPTGGEAVQEDAPQYHAVPHGDVAGGVGVAGLALHHPLGEFERGMLPREAMYRRHRLMRLEARAGRLPEVCRIHRSHDDRCGLHPDPWLHHSTSPSRSAHAVETTAVGVRSGLPLGSVNATKNSTGSPLSFRASCTSPGSSRKAEPAG